jgi:LssY C-terminus
VPKVRRDGSKNRRDQIAVAKHHCLKLTHARAASIILGDMSLGIRRDTDIAFRIIIFAVVVWALLAYVILPPLWRHYEHQHGLAGFSMVTLTHSGIPADPINVGLVGAKEDVLCAMNAAGWYPADPVTFRSSLEIVGSVLLDRPYHDAPVSPLLFQNRREDLAFEKPEGKSADRRHHVRFWKVLDHGDEGRAMWLGAVTYDRGVGFSHDDGRITHHISPNIDGERDLLSSDLKNAHVVTAIYEVTGVGGTLSGRNGEGDEYYTDGEIKISVLVDGCNTRSESVTVLANPPIVEMKNNAWEIIEKLLPGSTALPSNGGT